MATLEEGEDADALRACLKAPARLRHDGSADRDLVRIEQPVDQVSQRIFTPEEVDPSRRVDEDQRRVSSRSSENRTLPVPTGARSAFLDARSLATLR